MLTKSTLIALFVIATAMIGAVMLNTHSVARENPAQMPNGGIALTQLDALPKQARETLALIRKGGPFPYAKDGTIFGNRERILPKKERGYYKEYTVKTPGSRDRGARRIVCGGMVTHVARSECYYTDDHYASFKRIKE